MRRFNAAAIKDSCIVVSAFFEKRIMRAYRSFLNSLSFDFYTE